MDTITESIEKLVGTAPPGFEWLTYLMACIIALIGLFSLFNILSYLLSVGRRRY